MEAVIFYYASSNGHGDKVEVEIPAMEEYKEIEAPVQ